MEIYILRHGIAEPRKPGTPEAKRALTDEGREKLRPVLKRARAAKVIPEAILSSPYLRALETAEIAANVLGYDRPIVHTKALLPSSSPEAVWRELRGRKEGVVVIVGHEPLLSATLSYLVGAKRTVVDLKKGALARITIDQPAETPAGLLEWLLTPKTAS